MLPQIDTISLHRWILSNHPELDAAVKLQLPRSQIRSKSILRQQTRIRQRLPRLSLACHRNWNSLDLGRRSAACRFEWARLQIFMAARVHKTLLYSSSYFIFITLADERWRVPPERASAACFAAPRRKVRASIQKLRDQGYAPVFVVAYEISGNRSLTKEYAFEPHAHLILGGVPEVAVRAAFEVRQARAARGRAKPLRLDLIAPSEVGNLLGYITKMRAEDRVQYLDNHGRTQRGTNRMPPAEMDHWLRCMATMAIPQAIQFGGFAIPISSQFQHAKMATIIGELK